MGRNGRIFDDSVYEVVCRLLSRWLEKSSLQKEVRKLCRSRSVVHPPHCIFVSNDKLHNKMLFANRFHHYTPLSFKNSASTILAKPLSTLSSLLSFCSNTQTLQQIHARFIIFGLHQNPLLSSKLISSYSDLNHLHCAQQVFHSVNDPNTFLYNTIISTFSKFGEFEKTLPIYQQMIVNHMYPDEFTYPIVLKSCFLVQQVRELHAHVVVCNLSHNLSVNTALLTAYLKWGCLENAQILFAKMPERDSAIWNLMISGYSRNGYGKEALKLVVQMIRSGFKSDVFTAIGAISSVDSLEQGRQVHAHVIRNGLDYQISVYNSLIDMYARCDNIITARNIFDLLLSKTAISWSSMIKGYAKNGRYSDALSFFCGMKMEGMKPDSITVINILPACVDIGALEHVKYFHGYSIKLGFTLIPSLVTSLLISYSKCGYIEMAQQLFDEGDDSDKDVVSWNSMLSAYSKHGNWSVCFELFDRMKSSKLRPDRITFLELLNACVNSGFVNKGRQCFREMTEIYHCQPNQEHYACMVDLLARAGHIDDAMGITRRMPFQPDARIWGSILSACKLHSETKLAEFAAEKLLSMDPKNAGNYVLLSNIYAAAGKWDGVATMRSALRDKCLKKIPGCSWIEINGHVHEFRVAHRAHTESESIYAMLRSLELEIKLDKGGLNGRHLDSQPCLLPLP